MLCSEVLQMPLFNSKPTKVLGGIGIGVSCLMILLEMLKATDSACPVCHFLKRKFSRPLHFSNSICDFYLYFGVEKEN